MKTLDIKGSVIDVGGLFMPAKGRTKSWNVDMYHILDIKENRNGVKADVVVDLNTWRQIQHGTHYDNAFCIEVTDHFWNPVRAFQHINEFLKAGGKLYLSSNFLFPHHTGFDCMRYTITGLNKILHETGFRVLSTTPRFAVDEGLLEAMQKESKVVYHPGEIGYMIVAEKINYDER